MREWKWMIVQDGSWWGRGRVIAMMRWKIFYGYYSSGHQGWDQIVRWWVWALHKKVFTEFIEIQTTITAHAHTYIIGTSSNNTTSLYRLGKGHLKLNCHKSSSRNSWYTQWARFNIVSLDINLFLCENGTRRRRGIEYDAPHSHKNNNGQREKLHFLRMHSLVEKNRAFQEQLLWFRSWDYNNGLTNSIVLLEALKCVYSVDQNESVMNIRYLLSYIYLLLNGFQYHPFDL